MSAGHWQFSLIADNGRTVLAAHDCEPDLGAERLELLALVRGLEAIDEPSQVTLVTSSRYVRHGLSFGMEEWRENDWCWERFGSLAPINNVDLWKRVDRALEFHQVDCRTWRFDSAHATPGREPSARGPSWRRRAARAVAALQGGLAGEAQPVGA
jgi:ribonuclease HI